MGSGGLSLQGREFGVEGGGGGEEEEEGFLLLFRLREEGVFSFSFLERGEGLGEHCLYLLHLLLHLPSLGPQGRQEGLHLLLLLPQRPGERRRAGQRRDLFLKRRRRRRRLACLPRHRSVPHVVVLMVGVMGTHTPTHLSFLLLPTFSSFFSSFPRFPR